MALLKLLASLMQHTEITAWYWLNRLLSCNESIENKETPEKILMLVFNMLSRVSILPKEISGYCESQEYVSALKKYICEHKDEVKKNQSAFAQFVISMPVIR